MTHFIKQIFPKECPQVSFKPGPHGRSRKGQAPLALALGLLIGAFCLPLLEPSSVWAVEMRTVQTEDEGDPVDIPDPNLRKAINRHLRRKINTPITQKTFEKLEGDSLDFSSQGITNLTGLENLSSLYGINLADNYIQDLSPLTGIQNLGYVNISYNNLGSIASLDKAIRLHEPSQSGFSLDISGNPLESIDICATWPQLRELYINNMEGTDLSGLAQCKELVKLTAQNNHLDSFRWITPLTKLEELDLDFNELTDLTPLRELKNLRVLVLDHNHISDLRPLADLKKLTLCTCVDQTIRINFDETKSVLPNPLRNRDGSYLGVVDTDQVANVEDRSGLQIRSRNPGLVPLNPIPFMGPIAGLENKINSADGDNFSVFNFTGELLGPHATSSNNISYSEPSFKHDIDMGLQAAYDISGKPIYIREETEPAAATQENGSNPKAKASVPESSQKKPRIGVAQESSATDSDRQQAASSDGHLDTLADGQTAQGAEVVQLQKQMRSLSTLVSLLGGVLVLALAGGGYMAWKLLFQKKS